MPQIRFGEIEIFRNESGIEKLEDIFLFEIFTDAFPLVGRQTQFKMTVKLLKDLLCARAHAKIAAERESVTFGSKLKKEVLIGFGQLPNNV